MLLNVFKNNNLYRLFENRSEVTKSSQIFIYFLLFNVMCSKFALFSTCALKTLTFTSMYQTNTLTFIIQYQV